MKRKLYLLALLVFACCGAQAQTVSQYIFSQASGVYTPLAAPTVIATATDNTTSNVNSLDQGNFAVTLPFPFNFNGTFYTTANVNANGYMTFGTGLPTAATSTALSTANTCEGVIAAYARDIWGTYGTTGTLTSGSPTITGVTSFYGIAVGKPLRGPTGTPAGNTIIAYDVVGGTITLSANATAGAANGWICWPTGTISTGVEGISPNRTFIVQFSAFADYLVSAPNNYSMDFQIRLEEGGGIASNQLIKVVYGTYTGLSTGSRTSQVGLRGLTTADFNNRTSTTSWTASTAGGANNATMPRTNVIFPPSGQTFIWSPPALCTGTPTAGLAIASTANVCAGNNTGLSVSGYTSNVTGITLQWQESATLGGPYTNVTTGTGATTANYTTGALTSNTYFRCLVTCSNGGGNAPTNEVLIAVDDPQITGTTPATRCGTGPITLNATASPGATLNWYSASTGGLAVANGTSFNIPALANTANYWVSASIGGTTENVASPTATASTFYSNATGWGLRFTVNTPCTISSVKIKASNTTAGAATMQIKVTDLTDAVIYTGVLHNFSITTTLTEYTIPVNIAISPGSNYKMVMTATGITDLVRESSGMSFPYNSPSNAVSITAGANGVTTAQTTAAYYWFYNWVIATGCESARTQVTATVNTAPTLNVTSAATTACVGSSTTVNVTSVNDPDYTYSWTSSPAGFVAAGAGPHIITPSVNTVYTVTAIDNTAGPFAGCAASGSVSVISGVLTAGLITAPQQMFCTSGAPVLTLTGSAGGTIQWQESTVSSSGPWTNVGTGTTTYSPGTLTQTTYYRVEVTCQATTVTSIVTPITILTGTLAPGTYTINSNLPSVGTNFGSFKDAITALTCGGGAMTGPIVFNVDAASGPYNEQVIIPAIPGTSATNTITINGNGRTLAFNPTVTGERAVLKLNGTDHTTINNLVIEAAGGTYGFGIQLLNDADNNTISNCTINADMTSTSSANFAGIVINSTATAITTAGASLCDNNVITGNTVNGGYAGIAMVGNGSTSVINNNQIVNNLVRDFYLYGIYLNGNNNTLVEGNDLSRPTRSVVTTFDGIYLTGNSTNMLISKNRLHNPFDGNLTSTAAAFAIYFTSCNATAGNENIVSNNVVYNMIGGTGNHNGVLSNGSNFVNFYFNTFSLEDVTATCSDCGTRGFYTQGASVTGLAFKNNVVTINRGGTGRMQGIFFEASAATVATYVMDHNNYYIRPTATGSQMETARVGGASNNAATGTGYVTINDWILGSGQETGSIAADPAYTNAAAGNLRPMASAVDDLGTTIAGITTDILGALRSGTPDMGAYEFTFNPLDVKIISFSATPVGKDVHVNWKVAAETNIASYDVERSANGKDFIKIGVVTATGTSDYRFTDHSPEGTVLYYRLKINESDGRSNHSSVAIVKFGNSNSGDVTVYPNPFINKVRINVMTNQSTQASIRLTNIYGVAVKSTTKALEAGTNLIELNDLDALAPGVYNVYVEVNGNKYVQKLVK